MTYRQMIAFVEWLESVYGEPTRADHYAMQIAREVHQLNYILSSTRPDVAIDKFKLTFKSSRKVIAESAEAYKPLLDEDGKPLPSVSEMFWTGFLTMHSPGGPCDPNRGEQKGGA